MFTEVLPSGPTGTSPQTWQDVLRIRVQKSVDNAAQEEFEITLEEFFNADTGDISADSVYHYRRPAVKLCINHLAIYAIFL